MNNEGNCSGAPLYLRPGNVVSSRLESHLETMETLEGCADDRYLR